MSTASETVRLEGFENLDQIIAELDKEDFSRVLDAIGVFEVSQTQARFQDQVDPQGKPWKPSERAKRTGGKTLTDKGQLAASVTHRISPSAREVAVLSNKRYSAIHQYGGTIKAKDGGYLHFVGADGKDVFVKEVKMPARPYLGWSEQDIDGIKDMIGDWLVSRTSTTPR
ncbi:MAG: phage virion morphogenesis protein [Candidatus Latescibacterota bacterium]|jgi:phage virion morphogenesis protein|nr:MAG: phage virion morphogenesis protein [Candidatus Latescibacterota bacterium]